MLLAHFFRLIPSDHIIDLIFAIGEWAVFTIFDLNWNLNENLQLRLQLQVQLTCTRKPDGTFNINTNAKWSGILNQKKMLQETTHWAQCKDALESLHIADRLWLLTQDKEEKTAENNEKKKQKK